MSTEPAEIPVEAAHDELADAVERAFVDGEITYVTRGRAGERVAAIVPVELVETYQALIATERKRGSGAAARPCPPSRLAYSQLLSFSMSLTGSPPTGVTLRCVTPAARKASTRSRTWDSGPQRLVSSTISSGTAAAALSFLPSR
ncbi:hypothetical protein NOGI109294_22285 [Nocardiopsis gilva]